VVRCCTTMPKKKNPAAVALGRLGSMAAARRGARARFEALTAEERRELAKKAAAARRRRNGSKPQRTAEQAAALERR